MARSEMTEHSFLFLSKNDID